MDPLWNTDPSKGAPAQTFQWKSSCIPIANSNGKPDINVADIFCMDTSLLKGQRMPLPADVYPPHWSKRVVVENAIKESALKNDGTELVILQTDLAPSGIKSVYLGCKFCQMHRPALKHKLPQVNGKENTRPGVKTARIVNKACAMRGKAGKNEPKRAQTELPKRKEDQCQFKFRLSVIEGQHWFLTKKKKSEAMHTNHPPKDAKVDRTSMASLSQPEKEFACILSSPWRSCEDCPCSTSGIDTQHLSYQD